MSMRMLLLLHAVLLLLASTDFSIVAFAFRDVPVHWNYFRYASTDGFGTDYVSDYSLPVILTWLAAYAVGLTGFSRALSDGRVLAGLPGIALSIVGIISFGIEASHWIIDHHRSWIAVSPAVMFVLVLIAWLPDGRSHQTAATAALPGQTD